jgi:hypothetical protein
MNRHAVGVVIAGFLGGAAGAVGGCNFIVGVGDYAVAKDAGPILHAEAGKGHDGGSDAGSAGLLGDPCTKNSECTHGTCNGEWCTEPCKSNSSCEMNSIGEHNFCGQNSDGEFICIPGCETQADCLNFEGTTCAQIAGGTAFVCTLSTADGGFQGDSGIEGIIGDPCSGDSGCAVGTCNGASWCYTSCSSVTDPSCGANSLGEANHCAPTDSDSGFDCFPGCQTNIDCLPYSGTTCQPQTDGGEGPICGGTFGVIGDPCENFDGGVWAFCTGSDASTEQCNGTWCTAKCTSATDTSCGVSSTGQANRCINTLTDAGADAGFQCFPGCTSNDDCVQYLSFCNNLEAGAGATTYCGNL